MSHPNAHPGPVEGGARVAVLDGLPARYGPAPLADVVSVGPVNVRVRLLGEGTEHRVPLDAVERRRTLADVEAQAERPLVVIPCGGAKADHPAPARELYVGGYFRAALGAALALTSPDRIRILSARYGWLALDDEVAPYDQRIDAPGAVSVEELAATAGELAEADEVLVLAGKAYAGAARSALGDSVTVPAGLTQARGIGDHLATFAAITRTQEVPQP